MAYSYTMGLSTGLSTCPLMGAAGSRKTDSVVCVLDLSHCGTAWPMSESPKLNFRDMGDRALFIDAVSEATQAFDVKIGAYLYSKTFDFRVYFFNAPNYPHNGKKCRGVLIQDVSSSTYRDGKSHEVDFIPEEEFNNLTLDDVPTLITKWQLIAVF